MGRKIKFEEIVSHTY